jgi:hypothetical protein
MYGDISTNILHEVFKDGRITGLLVEHLLDKEFRNLTKAGGSGEAFDLFESTTRKVYECKSSKDAPFDIAPSSMKGSGRRFDRSECETRILAVDGVILCQLDNFPVLEFAVVRIPEDLDLVTIKNSSAKVSRKAWNTLRTRTA